MESFYFRCHLAGDHDPHPWRQGLDNFQCPGGPLPTVEQATKALSDLQNALAEGDKTATRAPRPGEKVCIGVPHLDTAGWNFTESVIRMAAYEKQHGDHLLHNSGLTNQGALCAVWGRSTEISHARNTATAAFLASDADWLLWWDSDIGAEPNALETLLEVANPETRPIVGGLCFIEGDYSHDFRGGLRSSLSPTLYDWYWVEPSSGMPGAYKIIPRTEWPANELTRVGATGCGFLLTHRSVYEKISAWLMDPKQGAPGNIWFERIPGPDGERCGEDISFCLRAHEIGLPIYVHTGVVTTHQKTVWYSTPDYRQKPATPPAMTARPLPPEQWPRLAINRDAARQAAETSPIRERQVPEVDVPVAIVVPVARRDTTAEQFIRSLNASLTEAQRKIVTVYVMADAEDRAAAVWEGLDSETPDGVIIEVDRHHYLRSMGSFAEKVNRGFEFSLGESWLFLVGDDVRFHRGWLDQAMETARTTGKAVIGTNDLGNRSVLAGEHATHMFIRRDYIQTVGASWDGPGVVAHEGYRHWFVDNEIVTAAKMRDQWAACLESHVEHLHPYYGKGAHDDVYRIGESAAEADRALWASRLAAAGPRAAEEES